MMIIRVRSCLLGRKKTQLLELFQPWGKDSAIDFMYYSKIAITLTSLWPFFFLIKTMICKSETSECKFYKVLWVNCALCSLLAVMKYWLGLRTSSGWEVEHEDPKKRDDDLWWELINSGAVLTPGANLAHACLWVSGIQLCVVGKSKHSPRHEPRKKRRIV